MSSEKWKSHVDSQTEQGQSEGCEGVHGNKDIAQVPASVVPPHQPRGQRLKDKGQVSNS